MLSSIWRGGTAIAGPDLVTSTVVAEDGSVSWIHALVRPTIGAHRASRLPLRDGRLAG
ncbi:MAG: hypothetical protein R3F05_11540 [Planctomycetota bacterium]